MVIEVLEFELIVKSRHSGPHLRNECTSENWAYCHFHKNLAFINMDDVSGGYDQIIGFNLFTRVFELAWT